MKYFLYTDFLPRLRALIKLLIRPAEFVQLSAEEVIGLWGPQKIKTFISIGANDGVKNDPINKYIQRYNWRGIMVEPLPSNFEKLQKNYAGNKNIILENAGIAEQSGKMSFYSLSNVQEDEPDWYDQVGSFDKDVFLKNISVQQELLSRMGVQEIECVRFDEILTRNLFQQVDLVMIDTEGYDFRILNSIDLSVYRPAVIVFEYEWLSHYEYKLAVSRFKKYGYRIIANGTDCIALKK